MNITFVDTCVLDELLAVPGFSQQSEKVREEFNRRIQAGERIVIPFAAMIELGNHIAGVKHDENRIRCADRFCEFLEMSLSNTEPWFLYMDGIGEETIKFVCQNFRELAETRIGIGDMEIVYQYQTYCQKGGTLTGTVQIWSLDHHISILQEKLKRNSVNSKKKIRRKSK